MSRPSCCPTIPLPRRASMWCALLGGAAFALIAADVVFHGQLQQMDMPIARWIAAHRPVRTLEHPETPTLILTASLITQFGSTGYVATMAAATGLTLAILRRWRLLVWGAITLIAEPGINWVLKQSFALPRPTMETSVYPLNHGYTFPSGHTMAACVAFGILAVIAGELWPRSRVSMWVMCAMVCAAVGAALVYVGVHYVSDVLAAYAVAACWVGAMARVWPKR